MKILTKTYREMAFIPESRRHFLKFDKKDSSTSWLAVERSALGKLTISEKE